MSHEQMQYLHVILILPTVHSHDKWLIFCCQLLSIFSLVQIVDHHESSILGPGFLSCLPPDTVLRGGQVCFVTHNGREVEGVVTQHHANQVSSAFSIHSSEESTCLIIIEQKTPL